MGKDMLYVYVCVCIRNTWAETCHLNLDAFTIDILGYSAEQCLGLWKYNSSLRIILHQDFILEFSGNDEIFIWIQKGYGFKKKSWWGLSLAVQWLRLALQKEQIWSLIRELKSPKKKKKKGRGRCQIKSWPKHCANKDVGTLNCSFPGWRLFRIDHGDKNTGALLIPVQASARCHVSLLIFPCRPLSLIYFFLDTM